MRNILKSPLKTPGSHIKSATPLSISKVPFPSFTSGSVSASAVVMHNIQLAVSQFEQQLKQELGLTLFLDFSCF